MTRIAPLELGPPVGWPVQYRVSGPDEEKVRDLALGLAKTMGENPSVTRINFDWIEPARAVHVKIDQDKARLLGLSSQAVANALQGVATGQTVTQVRDDIYLVDVVARAKDEQRMSLDTLQSLQLPLPDGGVAPLSQIATFEFGLERPLIWRRDRMPTLTVQADPASGLTPETAVAALAPAVAALNASLPPSYHIATGGTVEESAESQGSVFARIPLMLFLMTTFLMIQLQSFSRMFLVLAIVPMGLIGIIAALLIANKPLGFVAILGILSLLGMIARNAVILVEQIEIERGQQPHPWKAVGGRDSLAIPSHRADGRIDRARPHPHRADRLLGTHGFRRHGRIAGGDGADAHRHTSPLCGVVWRQRSGLEALAAGFGKPRTA